MVETIRETLAMSMTKFLGLLRIPFCKTIRTPCSCLRDSCGVPGIVAGVWLHLKSLRKMKTGYGSDIREMLSEAENERMHLMFLLRLQNQIGLKDI